MAGGTPRGPWEVSICQSRAGFGGSEKDSHAFSSDQVNGADLVCASVEFGASLGNPLVHGLPAPLVLPLSEAPALANVLDALFTEAFAERNGRHAALNGLSEVVLI